MPSFFLGTGPVIDIEETDNEIVVLAEMPGLEKEDFSVEVTADRLVLRGEKRREVEEQRAGYSYTERSFGSFARVIPLPCEVAAEKARAAYRNGLRRVSLPKTEWAKVKRVQVQVR
jgi:HSP20 family protein